MRGFSFNPSRSLYFLTRDSTLVLSDTRATCGHSPTAFCDIYPITPFMMALENHRQSVKHTATNEILKIKISRCSSNDGLADKSKSTIRSRSSIVI